VVLAARLLRAATFQSREGRHHSVDNVGIRRRSFGQLLILEAVANLLVDAKAVLGADQR